jgi:phenylacetate-coenzyme A ligase PaaK-like adenylate-forming protein
MAEIRGVTSADRIANLFPLARLPNGSWLRVNDHAFAIGALLVTGLGGAETEPPSATRRLAEVVRVVADADPTVLWGVPSYLRRFLEACQEEKRRLQSVRMAIASGEGLAPGVAASIERSLTDLGSPGAIVSPGFGASELQCSLVPCEPGAGLHNPAPELFLIQVVDDKGMTLPSGETGRLVLTHLDRTGTVLLRYALGDIVELARDQCPACGRSGERIAGHEGRADDKVKIRGQLVDLGVVLDTVAADPDVLEYAVEVRRPDPRVAASMDALVITVALAVGAPHREAVDRITTEVTAAVSVTPDVETADPDDIYAVDGRMKPKRLRVEE